MAMVDCFLKMSLKLISRPFEEEQLYKCIFVIVARTWVIISETWWTVQPCTMFPAHSLQRNLVVFGTTLLYFYILHITLL